MPLEAAMRGRARQVRSRRLKGVEAVVSGNRVCRRKATAIASCSAVSTVERGVVDELALAPLRERLGVQPVVGELFERSLRSLYRSTDGVRGRGAAVEHLSHNASRKAGSAKLIPSHSRTRHLGALLVVKHAEGQGERHGQKTSAQSEGYGKPPTHVRSSHVEDFNLPPTSRHPKRA